MDPSEMVAKTTTGEWKGVLQAHFYKLSETGLLLTLWP